MLGRKTLTSEELDRAKQSVNQQLTAYQALVAAVEASGDAHAKSALEAFEPLFFNNWRSRSIARSSTACAWSPARTATSSTSSS